MRAGQYSSKYQDASRSVRRTPFLAPAMLTAFSVACSRSVITVRSERSTVHDVRTRAYSMLHKQSIVSNHAVPQANSVGPYAPPVLSSSQYRVARA
eukprot:3032608-Rhodomonas_salina.2